MTPAASTPGSRSSYDPVARILHWSMALLIAAAFAIGLVVDAFPKAWEHPIVEAHKLLGLAILLLTLIRIGWRSKHRPPPDELPPLARRVAGLGHFGLYILMIAVPAIGLAYALLRGQGLDFGLFSVPPVMTADRVLARPLRNVHELVAYALIGLAALHALAALWHHLVLKDKTLRRMTGRA